MLSRVIRFLYGSNISGKRQAGWTMFFIVTAILIWIVRKHGPGHDMSPFVGLMTIAWPTSMGAALGPHILHHLKPEKYQ